MAFTDMFNPVFLLSLGVILIITGAMVIYYEGKIRDQNHKINAMFSIVTTLVEKVNELKERVEEGDEEGGDEEEENMKQVFIEPSSQHGGKLIEVSDDEIMEESEDEDEYEDEEDELDVEDVDMDEDDLDVEDVDMEDVNEVDMDMEDVENKEDIDVVEVIKEGVKEEEVENVEEVKEKGEKKPEESKEEKRGTEDYKKKTLPELRKMAVAQGLIFDASKLKKPELIKLFMTIEETQR